MKVPQIITSKVVALLTLLVGFSDGSKKQYNIEKFSKKHDWYESLKNINYLKDFTIEPGGYALSWGNEMDIAEYEIWKNGVTA